MTLAATDVRPLEVDRLDLLLSQLPSVLLANSLNPLVLWLTVGRGAPLSWAGWTLAHGLLSLFRWWRARSLRHALDDGKVESTARSLTFHSVLSGLLWGAGAVFLMDQRPASLLAFSFVLGGMVTAAAGTTAVHLRVFVGFAVAALVPLCVRLWLLPHDLVGPMPVLVALFLVLMTGVARRTHRSMNHSFELRYEKAALLTSLGRARTQLEESNQALEARVEERTRELTAQRTRLAQWIRDAPDGLLTLVQGRVLAVNPALVRMLGRTSEALVGAELSTLPGFTNDKAKTLLEVSSREGQATLATSVELGGETHHLEVHATEAHEQLGQVELVVRDVTERILAEQRMHAFEDNAHRAARLEAVRRLSGGVAHEFNNILAVILGTVERLLLDEQSEDVRAGLEESRSAALRAASITRQLLSVSQRRRAQSERVDLNEFVRAERSTLERIAGQELRVELALAEESLPIQVDRSQLEEVLFHLALYLSELSARDARDQRIVLRTTRAENGAGEKSDVAGPWAVLEIRDTRSRHQASEVHGEDGKLELLAAHGLLQQQGGFFVREVTTDGAGFRLGWPLQAEAAAVTSVAVPSLAPPAKGGEERVLLIVDDEPALLALVTAALRESGFVVLTAKSADEALLVEDRTVGPIHGLLTDVVMPGMDGPTLASELRKRRPGIKVCFMSGYTAAYLEGASRVDPNSALLEKPFSLSKLVKAAEDMVRK